MLPSSPIDRRSALGFAAAGAALLQAPAFARSAGGIGALAFDGFTIFDPRPVTAAVAHLVPEKGAALAGAWTNKIFALSWLETSAGRYSGFAALADAALEHSARSASIDLSAAQRRELVDVFGNLPAWPDAAAALEKMRSAGLRLALLSNISAAMLSANMQRNGLDKIMEPPLSTDSVRAFKPSPAAYAMGPKYFGMDRDRIGFVAFGGWDALGAKWFGYRTAWINRLSVVQETLTPAPDTTATDLSAALALAGLAA